MTAGNSRADKQEASREKRLARHARYNGSAKGQERNRRYEEAQPERRNRWAVLAMTRSRST